MQQSFRTDLIRSASLEEMCAHRDRAIAIFEQMKGLRTSFAEACGRGLSRSLPGLYFSTCYHGPNTDDIRPEVDRSFWREVLDKSGMRRLMGARQISEFEESLEKSPPEFTLENVQATFSVYAENPRAVFNRSIIDLFERLPDCYKSNDAFKIGSRIVLTCAYSPSWSGWTHLSYGHCRRDQIRDLHRIFRILDGKNDEDSFIESASVAMRDRDQNQFEDEYIRVRWFQNGNVHLWLLRPELVRDVNKIIAQYYGDALADCA